MLSRANSQSSAAGSGRANTIDDLALKILGQLEECLCSFKNRWTILL